MMTPRKPASLNGSSCRCSEIRVSKKILEGRGAICESLQIGGCISLVSINRDVLGSERVNGDEIKVGESGTNHSLRRVNEIVKDTDTPEPQATHCDCYNNDVKPPDWREARGTQLLQA